MFLSEVFSANEQSVDDAVMFHSNLNPFIWQNNKMKPIIRYKLLKIALEFAKYIGIKNLGLTDIIMTGSNASYNYTNYSDIDLHLVVNIPENNEAIKELFDAKKGLWNEQHDIKIKGFDVELYVQDASEPHISSGMYSILNDTWIKEPKPVRPDIDDVSVEKKYYQYHDAIQAAVKDNDFNKLEKIKSDIKKMRQSGLDKAGEFSAENLAFKLLRNLGDMEILMNTLAKLKDQQLGLKELHKT
jgi:hypothetical protein